MTQTDVTREQPTTVLLFSGCAGTEDLLSQAKSNGHHFEILAKPVHPTFLLEAAGRVLAN
jgi:hypothetical protein